MTVTSAGFKNFVRQGIVVDVAQTYRVDANLEVGSQTESVTVTEAAPLLKTDSGELSRADWRPLSVFIRICAFGRGQAVGSITSYKIVSSHMEYMSRTACSRAPLPSEPRS
jgi:hypothetical protein